MIQGKDSYIFLVDSNAMCAPLFEQSIQHDLDIKIEHYESGQSCLKNLYKKPAVAIICDDLPDLRAGEIMGMIHKECPLMPVIILSEHNDSREAVGLVRGGAYDYIVNDEQAVIRLHENLREIYRNIHPDDTRDNRNEPKVDRTLLSNGIVGTSAQLNKVIDLMEKAVKSDITVTITGETGTGKEQVAKNIHANSRRKNQSFIAIDLVAIPRELVESELFGHEKGAFTGANQRRIGRFEEANGGTIFLDEISEIDLSTQLKLLRVIQEKEITRVGSNLPVKTDVRLIIASQNKLSEYVRMGGFRPDLYYRLAGLPIHLPPLRERVDDIMILARYFAAAFCKKNKLTHVTFSAAARKLLISYHYPGNVRELQSIVELAVVMATGDFIMPADIIFPEIDEDAKEEMAEHTIDEIIVGIIRKNLMKYNHNVLTVAKKLDIGKSTLYRIMKKNNIR